eukprot:m51a1_g12297 putative sulfotransferase (432) ;mRNA; r:323327-324858
MSATTDNYDSPTWRVQLLNWVLWAVGPRVELTESWARTAGSARANGLSDFAPLEADGTVAMMAARCESLERESGLNLTGRLLMGNAMARVYHTRLLANDILARFPEITEVHMPALQPPVVVTGMFRSGTTLMQNLLAQDERFQYLRVWEMLRPSPSRECFEARDRGLSDPRLAEVQRDLRVWGFVNPAMEAIHKLEPEAADEELWILQSSLSWGHAWENFARTPSFLKAMEARGEEGKQAAYQLLRKQLALIEWFNRVPAGKKPWLLKTPAHLRALETLSKVFPGVKIVWMHRSPVETVPSLSSMLWTHRRDLVLSKDKADPAEIGRQTLEDVSRALGDAVAARDADPELSSRIVDVRYADMVRDKMATVRAVYRAIGWELGEQTEQRMLRYIAENPQTKHGRHSYKPEDFGLTREAIEAKTQGYIDRNYF